jgi:hypothetical protein
MTIITVKTGGIAADAVTDAKIADDVVGTEHLTANEVDTAALGADAVTAAQIADDAISEEHLDVTAITGHTAETTVADGDLVVVHDASASALRKMTVANLVANAGGGKVLQVIMGTDNSYQTSSTSTTLADVLSASGTTWETAITPSATSSKILVLPSVYVRGHNNSAAEARGHINMMAKIGSGDYANIDKGYEFTGGYDYGNSGLIIAKFYNPMLLHTSNTTSEVKYKFQIATDGGTVTTDWGSGGAPELTGRLILMEIGA